MQGATRRGAGKQRQDYTRGCPGRGGSRAPSPGAQLPEVGPRGGAPGPACALACTRRPPPATPQQPRRHGVRAPSQRPLCFASLLSDCCVGVSSSRVEVAGAPAHTRPAASQPSRRLRTNKWPASAAGPAPRGPRGLSSLRQLVVGCVCARPEFPGGVSSAVPSAAASQGWRPALAQRHGTFVLSFCAGPARKRSRNTPLKTEPHQDRLPGQATGRRDRRGRAGRLFSESGADQDSAAKRGTQAFRLVLTPDGKLTAGRLFVNQPFKCARAVCVWGLCLCGVEARSNVRRARGFLCVRFLQLRRQTTRTACDCLSFPAGR